MAFIKTNLNYTTYYKFFKRLVDNKIIKIAFFLINLIQKKKNNYVNLNLFIDATNIRNVNGKDKLGITIKDKCKKGNKISVIVDANRISLIIKIIEANKHDIRILYPNIMNIKNREFKNVNLIADKGYINKNIKKMLNTMHINFNYPYKKNQYNKNTENELILLKKRIKIENFFCLLK